MRPDGRQYHLDRQELHIPQIGTFTAPRNTYPAIQKSLMASRFNTFKWYLVLGSFQAVTSLPDAFIALAYSSGFLITTWNITPQRLFKLKFSETVTKSRPKNPFDENHRPCITGAFNTFQKTGSFELLGFSVWSRAAITISRYPYRN